MIRQLRSLTRAVPGLGPDVLALAVYAHPRAAAFAPHAAAEQGYEGVACVDDAARAAVLYCRIWQRHGSRWARDHAEGLLAFVCAMQEENGEFANFIADWGGHRQLHGPTSRPGAGPWHARGMHALASGVAAFGSARYRSAFERGLPALDRFTPHLDTRSIAALAALEYAQATVAPDVEARAIAWGEEIAAARTGDVLPNFAGETDVHLWGHLQEAALARIGDAFGRDDLVQVAARSADALLVPAVERSFAGTRSLAFDVSCVVSGLDAVGIATSDPRYAEFAEDARLWFDGRNATGRPVYDRVRGLVFDGIDEDRLNEDSGAESNIEGAHALLDSLPWDRYELSGDLQPVGDVVAR